jgi:alpha-L-fucosidase 2
MNDNSNSGMILRYPATRWQDALPTGSGVVGAMVYGNIQTDTILLNHDALYYPTGRPPTVDVSEHLPEVRRLISEGQCREAAQIMPDAYAQATGAELGTTSRYRDPYQPFCSIGVAMGTDGPFRDYRRGLDFDTGRVWVQWTDNTAAYTREVFVSRVTDAVYLRIRGSAPGSVSCRLALAKARDEQSPGATVAASKLDQIKLTTTQSASAEDSTLTFSGTYANGFTFGAIGVRDRPPAARSPGRARGAAHHRRPRRWCCGYAWYLGEEPDQAARLLSDLTRQRRTVFRRRPVTEHAALHRELFRRVAVSLGESRMRRRQRSNCSWPAFDGDVSERARCSACTRSVGSC